TVVEGLEKDLKSKEKEQEFVILKYKDEIIGFLRFEKIDDNNVIFGSFNIFKDLHGLKIAEQTLLEIVKEKVKEKNIRATVSPRIRIGTCYIEKTGFVGTGYIPNYHQTGEPLIEIEIDEEKNSRFEYRRANEEGKMLNSPKDIISQWQNNDYQTGQETIILKYNFKNPEEFQEYHEAMQKLLGEKKYVLTRYFQDVKEKGDIRYLVLEKTQ
ncbi:MAG: hypothetical protein PHU73_04725, partial [Patescibacteria group bacterium]|nr:hypothetical protein [Patescibacteria group bacterium]